MRCYKRTITVSIECSDEHRDDDALVKIFVRAIYRSIVKSTVASIASADCPSSAPTSRQGQPVAGALTPTGYPLDEED